MDQPQHLYCRDFQGAVGGHGGREEDRIEALEFGGSISYACVESRRFQGVLVPYKKKYVCQTIGVLKRCF
jgi:hypothetical protein